MAYFLAICAVAFWSSNAVVARFVLEDLPVEQVQFLQFLGAAFVFFVLHFKARAFSNIIGSLFPCLSLVSNGKSDKLCFNENVKRSRRSVQKLLKPMPMLLGAIGLTGTMVFQYLAFDFGPIVHVNIIAYAWPLLTVLLTIVSGRAQNPKRLLVLAGFGFLGAALIVGDADGGNTINEFAIFGFVSALASAACMAVFSFGIGKIHADVNDVLTIGALLGLAITSVWCFSGDPNWRALGPVLQGLYLGAGPMGFGYLLWSKAMQIDQTGHAAIIGFLTPTTSTGLLLLAGAEFGLQVFIGAALVLGVCACVGLQSWRASRG